MVEDVTTFDRLGVTRMMGVGCSIGFDFHHEARIEFIQVNLGDTIIGEAMLNFRLGEIQEVGRNSISMECFECMLDLI